MANFEVDGEIWGDFDLQGKEMEELLAFAEEAEPDPTKIIDRGPGGHSYYDDVIDKETVSWCFAYARQHSEDAYIQDRVRNFQDMNREYLQRHGTNMPGYDATYFPEDAANQ